MDSNYILLSADGPGFVYLVLSIVADNLENISYLRKFKLIEGEYSFVEEIQDIWWDAELPEKYRNIPWFNF